MKKRFTVQDHSVSKEEFELVYEENLALYKTVPQPCPEDLPRYYLSEDYISHTDKKRSLIEKVYHVVRYYSLNRKLKLINRYHLEEKTLLDIGCGTGDFLARVQKTGWMVHGIEPNESARNIANIKTDGKVLKPENLRDFKFGFFEVITLWHVLEHLPDLDKQITILKSLLKDNGRIIIAVPNFKSYDAHYYDRYWAAYDVPRHLWHFSKDSIDKIFIKHGMIVEERLPLKFDSYYVSLLSEKYKNGKSNMIQAFRTGFLSNLKGRQNGEYSSLIYVIKRN